MGTGVAFAVETHLKPLDMAYSDFKAAYGPSDGHFWRNLRFWTTLRITVVGSMPWSFLGGK